MTREEEIKIRADKYCLDEYTRLGFIAGAEWADAHPHWISVEDELPKDDVHVTTINKFGVQEVRHYFRGKWYSNFGNEYGSITHWMPIPQLPKKGDKE